MTGALPVCCTVYRGSVPGKHCACNITVYQQEDGAIYNRGGAASWASQGTRMARLPSMNNLECVAAADTAPS